MANVPADEKKGLLDLPPELRNTIWRYVVVSEDPIEVLSVSSSTDASETKAIVFDAPPQQPALTRTSRAIRDESLSIYYAENVFDLALVDLRPLEFTKASSGLASWRKISGPFFCYLRHVSIMINHVEDDPFHTGGTTQLDADVETDGDIVVKMANISSNPSTPACTCQLEKVAKRSATKKNMNGVRLIEVARTLLDKSTMEYLPQDCKKCGLPMLDVVLT